MLFSSIIFVFYFLPLTMVGYYIIPERYSFYRNYVLLLASLVFYSWGEPVYVLLMIFSAFFNYYMALEIDREKDNGGTGKKNLIFAVVINLLILGFFKYFGFIMDTINVIPGVDIAYHALPLPIGISFYTFQAMSYIFDVHKGTVRSQKRFMIFALYLSLFPQLIAGPIVKYRDVEEQLISREVSLEKFGVGATRFVYGLGKKVLLANSFGALNASIMALGDSRVTVVTYWIGIIAYTLQIYFDFSGYSDMAIGLGKMFGFDFNENFNYPYISRSITEFWRRWHMSLSTWFREYVYIPLGGNRVAVKRHILNLMIVWSLTGLWHGASWNFVFWGMYYGVLLVLEKYVIGDSIAKLPEWAQHLYSLLIVVVGWVFFSITDVHTMLRYLAVMFGFGGVGFADITTLYYLRTEGLMLIAGMVLSTPKPQEAASRLCDKYPAVQGVLVAAIMIMSIAHLIYGSYNPFLYFRF